MTRGKFETVVAAPEYDFLRNDPPLGGCIMLLAFGGSHAYGTKGIRRQAAARSGIQAEVLKSPEPVL